MNLSRFPIALALLGAPALAPAAVPAMLDVLYVPTADSQVSNPVYLSPVAEGDGYGIRGYLRPTPRLFWVAEMQTNTYRSTTADIKGDVMRLGMGTPLIKRERIEFYGLAEVLTADFADRKANVDIINEGGLGLHLGLTADVADAVTLHARVGELKLDDSDGREFLAGVAARLDDNVGGVIEYRRSEVDSIMGLGTPERVNYQFSEIRVAVRFYFGEPDRP